MKNLKFIGLILLTFLFAGSVFGQKDTECPLTTEKFKLKYIPNEEAFTGKKQILGIIKRRLSKRGSVEFDDDSNILIITDVDKHIKVFKELIKLLDSEENIRGNLKLKKKCEEAAKIMDASNVLNNQRF
jgi:type II secretory pathway component GspD/PulD (secretin)